MPTKREKLIALIEECILAPSESALCKIIGRKDKHVSERLRGVSSNKPNGKGKNKYMKDETVEELCQRICNAYEISEDILFSLHDLWDDAIALSKDIDMDHFLSAYEGHLSMVRNAKLRKRMQAMYEEEPMQFYYVMAWVYTRIRQFNPNRHRKNDVLTQCLRDIDSLLSNRYKENKAAYDICDASIRQAQYMNLCGWTHLMVYLGMVMCYYRHPEMIDQLTSQCESMLPFDELQWLIDTHADPNETDLWCLCGQNGVYDVMKVHAVQHHPFNQADSIVQRWGFLKDAQKLVIHSHHMDNGSLDSISYYWYRWTEKDNSFLLETEKVDELCDSRCVHLPACLQPLEANSTWKNWLNQQDQDFMEDTFYALAAQFIGLRPVDGIEVIDVQMNRKSCRVILQRNEKTKPVCLNKEDCPWLERISVWDDVELYQQSSDGSYCLYWYKLRIIYLVQEEDIPL